MRHILQTAALCAGSALLSVAGVAVAQSSTSPLFIDTSGNIGINTTTPKGPLDIYGQTALNRNPLNLSNITDTTHQVSYSANKYSLGDVDWWDFYTNLIISSNGVPVMNLQGGSVGIGILNPGAQGAPLVVQNQNANLLKLMSTQSGMGQAAGMSLLPNASASSMPALVQGVSSSFNSLNTTDLVLNTNGAERMRVTSGGFVGVGTSAPAVPLHVKGGEAWGTGIQLDATATSGGKTWLIQSSGGTAGQGKGLLVIKNITDDRDVLLIHSDASVQVKNNIQFDVPSSIPTCDSGYEGRLVYARDSSDQKDTQGWLFVCVFHGTDDGYRWEQLQDKQYEDTFYNKSGNKVGSGSTSAKANRTPRKAAQLSQENAQLSREVETLKASVAALTSLVCQDHPKSPVCKR